MDIAMAMTPATATAVSVSMAVERQSINCYHRQKKQMIDNVMMKWGWTWRWSWSYEIKLKKSRNDDDDDKLIAAVYCHGNTVTVLQYYYVNWAVYRGIKTYNTDYRTLNTHKIQTIYTSLPSSSSSLSNPRISTYQHIIISKTKTDRKRRRTWEYCSYSIIRDWLTITSNP